MLHVPYNVAFPDDSLDKQIIRNKVRNKIITAEPRM